jgi:hypothetical protein
MRSDRTAYRLVLAAISGLTSSDIFAAPDEIQVYTEEMDDPGEFGLELHVNYVPKGEKRAPYVGAMPSNHMLQMTPEFSYGVTKTLEAGLYLPVAVSPDGHTYSNGARLRMKYIAPRDDGDPFFCGLNTEVGYFSRRVSESSWAMELRPILGYRSNGWLFSFNPILDVDLSTSVSREPKFEPALKLTHVVRDGVQAGYEYYGEFGPIHYRLPANERGHYLYGVVDIEMKGFDINFGIGRGFVNASDSWVTKAIISLPFK